MIIVSLSRTSPTTVSCVAGCNCSTRSPTLSSAYRRNMAIHRKVNSGISGISGCPSFFLGRYRHRTWWIILRASQERISGWVSPQSTLQKGCFIQYVNAPVPVFPFPKPPPALSQGVVSCPSCSHEGAWHLREGMAQHFSRRPSSVGSPRCHGWSTLKVSLRQKIATSLSRLHEPDPQRGMGAYKMMVHTPPLQMGQQLWGLLSSGPSPSRESCHAMADGQIHALDESRVQSPRKTYPLKATERSAS